MDIRSLLTSRGIKLDGGVLHRNSAQKAGLPFDQMVEKLGDAKASSLDISLLAGLPPEELKQLFGSITKDEKLAKDLTRSNTEKTISSLTSLLLEKKEQTYNRGDTRRAIARAESVAKSLERMGEEEGANLLPQGEALLAAFRSYGSRMMELKGIVDSIEKDTRLLVPVIKRLMKTLDRFRVDDGFPIEDFDRVSNPFDVADLQLDQLIDRAKEDSPDGSIGRWEHCFHPCRYLEYLGRAWVPWKSDETDPALEGFLRGHDLPERSKSFDLNWGKFRTVKDRSGAVVAHAYVIPQWSEEDLQNHQTHLLRTAELRRQTPLPSRTKLIESLLEKHLSTDALIAAKKRAIEKSKTDLKVEIESASQIFTKDKIKSTAEDLASHLELDAAALVSALDEPPPAVLETIASVDVEAWAEQLKEDLAHLGTNAPRTTRNPPEVSSEVPFELFGWANSVSFFHLPTQFVDRLVSCAYEAPVDLSEIDMAEVGSAMPHFIESMLNHDFSGDSLASLAVRAVAHDDGVRLEILGRGDHPLPEVLTSQPWFSPSNRPWWGVPPDSARGKKSGRGQGIRAALSEFDTATRGREILVSWRKSDGQEPYPEGNVVAIDFPRSNSEA